MWRPVTPVVESVAPYVLGWLVASLVIAILVMAITLTVRNRVTDNLRMMVKFTNDVRQQRLRTDYPVSLAEFQTPLETMLKLGRVMLGRQKEVTSQARLDHLSQVNNRRSFDEKQKELFASLKDGWSHSLLILDIDNFKQVNDTFGHEAGDQLIIKFGNALKTLPAQQRFHRPPGRRRILRAVSLHAAGSRAGAGGSPARQHAGKRRADPGRDAEAVVERRPVRIQPRRQGRKRGAGARRRGLAGSQAQRPQCHAGQGRRLNRCNQQPIASMPHSASTGALPQRT